jgi:hypothetical protein
MAAFLFQECCGFLEAVFYTHQRQRVECETALAEEASQEEMRDVVESVPEGVYRTVSRKAPNCQGSVSSPGVRTAMLDSLLAAAARGKGLSTQTRSSIQFLG